MDEPLSTSPRTVVVTLPELHPGQMQVAEHPARFKVLAAGRRWGKSRLASLLCLIVALNERGRVWWVGPSHPQASGAWRDLRELARQIPGCHVREDERRITMPSGGVVEVKSAESGASLRGAGLDLVVVDEAAFIAEEVWTAVLRPALSDRQGRALLISTPNGFNWFFAAHQRGLGGAEGWAAWTFPTASSPFIASAEVEEARGTLPERVFLAEYEAIFTDMAGAVFRGVRLCATAEPQERAAADHTYIFGVDWARSGDYTVTAILDATTRALVALDRHTGAEYAIQVARLHALAERFRPAVIVCETNSMGGPIFEQLSRERLPVRPFQTTQATKAHAIDALALAFEQRQIRIIPDPVLLGELQAYVAERLPSGLLRYGAAHGHDDTVMALAIAWQAAARPQSSAVGAFAI
jgi:hypothetical protein